MTLAKFRAAILVFVVGFALGLSVFIASRMFVRAILSNDAIAAAEELAPELADGEAGSTGALSCVVRYSYFDLDGRVVASESPGGQAPDHPLTSESDVAGLAEAVSEGRAVVEEASLLASLLGLSE